MSKCVIVVDDKHPDTTDGYNVALLLSCLKELAVERHKKIVFVFVYAEDGFSEPMTVYLVCLHACAAKLAKLTIGGIASDCFKQGNDVYKEGDKGGLLLLDALESIATFPANPRQFASAKEIVQKVWSESGYMVNLSKINIKNLYSSVVKSLDDKPYCFYTATYVDGARLSKKYGRNIVWLESLQPKDRAKEIFMKLKL